MLLILGDQIWRWGRSTDYKSQDDFLDDRMGYKKLFSACEQLGVNSYHEIG